MNVTALKHVRQLWNVDYVPSHINRHNQLEWVKSVRLLGDKWLIAKPLEKHCEKN